MRTHKLFILVAMMGIALLLPGCAIFEKEVDNTEKVNIVSADSIDTGFYIKTGDNCIALYTNYQLEEQGDRSKIWLIGNQYMIPILYSDSVIIYATNESPVPSIFELKEYEDRGYTFGISEIYRNNIVLDKGEEEADETQTTQTPNTNTDSFMLQIGQSYCIGSDAESVFAIHKNNGTILQLHSINGDKLIDKNFDSIGAFVGLKKDASYKLGFYRGTKYGEVDCKADSNLLVMTDKTTCYRGEMTKDGYMIMKLPTDMKNGYYTINKELFYYAGDRDSSKEVKLG